MGKVAPDATIDSSLNYVAASDYICVCSGSPATYADAKATLILAGQVCTSGCFTGPADGSPNGRTLTMVARTSASITASGSALAVALVKISDTTLRYVTTCTSQYLVSGGTVDVPSWTINIADPT
jgi:hypothetical protein